MPYLPGGMETDVKQLLCDQMNDDHTLNQHIVALENRESDYLVYQYKRLLCWRFHPNLIIVCCKLVTLVTLIYSFQCRNCLTLRLAGHQRSHSMMRLLV